MDIPKTMAVLVRSAYSTYYQVKLRFLMFGRGRIVKKQAKRGVADAQAILGAMYSAGIGVAKDNREAFRWYYRAAKQGNNRAQLIVGLRYVLGLGVVRNHVEAIRWHSKSAEQNNRYAQVALGLMFANGVGVMKNETQAVLWFNLAFSGEEREQREMLNLLQSLVVNRGIDQERNLIYCL